MGRLFDRQGRGPVCRPAVILTPTDQIDPNGTVVVAAVTTHIGMSPPDRTVALPWHRDKRQSRTGLTAPSEVVCDWVVDVAVSAIQNPAGHVPTALLIQILDKVRQFSPSQPASPPPQPPPQTSPPPPPDAP